MKEKEHVQLTLEDRKYLLWKRYVHTKSSYDHSAFLRAEYENNIVKKMKDKPKIFWRYVNSKLKTRERIPTFKNMNGTFSVSPLEEVEALNQYLLMKLNDIPISPDVSSEHLNTIGFTKEMILEKLQALSPSKSKGPDGWHPYFLRELSEELSKHMSMLFQKSLKERVVPTDWLRTCITVIHKTEQRKFLVTIDP